MLTKTESLIAPQASNGRAKLFVSQHGRIVAANGEIYRCCVELELTTDSANFHNRLSMAVLNRNLEWKAIDSHGMLEVVAVACRQVKAMSKDELKALGQHDAASFARNGDLSFEAAVAYFMSPDIKRLHAMADENRDAALNDPIIAGELTKGWDFLETMFG